MLPSALIIVLLASFSQATLTCHASTEPLENCGGGLTLGLANCLDLCQCGSPESGIGLECFSLGSCLVIDQCESAFGCHCS